MKTGSFAAALGMCAITVLAQGATLDGLAAKVNDAVITVGDVVNEMRRGDSKQDFRTAYSLSLIHI